MGSINLKEYFMQCAYRKLDAELKCYKQKMYQLSAKEVFNHAYEIDSYINIYEILLMKIEHLTTAQLCGIILMPNILSLFYDRWLNTEDSAAEDMDVAISKVIQAELDISRKWVG